MLTGSVSSDGSRSPADLSCCVCCCLSEIEAKYDKKMKMLRDELDLRRKTEIHEVEERKNGQINTLMQRHEEAFTDIKNYYNDITLNNLALINSLKVLMSSGRHAQGLRVQTPPLIPPDLALLTVITLGCVLLLLSGIIHK